MTVYRKTPAGSIPVTVRSRVGGVSVPVIFRRPEGATTPVDPDPGTQPPNQVTINGVTRALNGINTFRDINHLTLYTPDYALVTPTNQYGTEVTVINNVVTSVVNRNAFGSATGTAIPANGYVLSGHEAGDPIFPATSAKWLRDNATIGAQVLLSYNAELPEEPEEPETPPVDPNDPGVPNVPEEIYIWHQGWNNGNGSTPSFNDYPLDVRNEADVLIFSMGQSAQSGTGKLTDPPVDGFGSVAEAKRQAQAFINSAPNKRVLYGFGGSNDGGIRCTNTTQAEEIVASVNRVVANYGVNGISIDMEGAPGGTWTKEAMTYACQKLKQTHGNSFFIDACFALYDDKIIKWPEFLVYAGNAVDRASVMLYDFDEAMDSRIINVTKDKLRILRDRGVPLSKAVMLYAAQPTWYYRQTTPNPQLVADAVNAGKAAYGADGYDGKYGWWEDMALRSKNWDFFRQCVTLI